MHWITKLFNDWSHSLVEYSLKYAANSSQTSSLATTYPRSVTSFALLWVGQSHFAAGKILWLFLKQNLATAANTRKSPPGCLKSIVLCSCWARWVWHLFEIFVSARSSITTTFSYFMQIFDFLLWWKNRNLQYGNFKSMGFEFGGFAWSTATRGCPRNRGNTHHSTPPARLLFN